MKGLLVPTSQWRRNKYFSSKRSIILDLYAEYVER